MFSLQDTSVLQMLGARLSLDFDDGWQAIFFWTLLVRHLCCCFDKNPKLRPIPTPLTEEFDTANYGQTSLSDAQVAQISEIFNLFDTDGTGCIEQREIGFALSALGFQTEADGKSQEELDAFDEIMGDGKVTLEEFSALMTGDIGGHALYEEARMAFAVLSRPDGNSRNDGLITLNKLEAVCLEFRVQLPLTPSCIVHCSFIRRSCPMLMRGFYSYCCRLRT
jgi:Ca2+-binding EF-hand superfamily protein